MKRPSGHSYLDRVRPIIDHAGVFLGYLLISLVLTWPLVLHWQTAVVGGIQPGTVPPDYNPRFLYGGFEDASQNVWNVWWTGWALEHGQNPYWSSMLYYPQGVQMYLQTLNLPSTLAVQPVHALVGPVAAYNVSVLLACALTGYGTFLLVRAFVPGMAIPFLCGALLMAGPFHLMKIQTNQLNLVSMQWLPLFFLALVWLDRQAEHRDDPVHHASYRPQTIAAIARHPTFAVLFAVAMFSLAALTDWYWGLICAIYALLWMGLRLVTTPTYAVLVRRYMWFGAGVLVCLAPVFLGIARVDAADIPAMGNLSTWQGYVAGYSADALGLFFPSVFHPLGGEWARHLLANVSPGYAPDGWYVAAGWVLLACAAWGIWVSWRTHWRLLIIAAVAWVLSLGPSLRVAGVDTGMPLPYAIIQHVPLLGMARRPSHFAAIVFVLAAVFAGIGLHQLRVTLPPRRWAMLLIGVSILAVIELWPPRRDLFHFEQADLFGRIATQPGALADLPMEWMETSRSLRHQMLHQQPIMAGYVARRPVYYTRRYMPHLNWISSMRVEPDIVPLTHDDLAAMQCAYPVRHLLVNKQVTPPERLPELAAVVTALSDGPLPPAFEDERYLWYDVPLYPDHCQPFVYLGAGWHEREYNQTNQWRWARDASDIWLVNPFDQPVTVTLRLNMEAFAAPRPVELWDGEHMLGRWTVARERQFYRVLVRLLPGDTRLQLRTQMAYDAATERDLSVSVREVALEVDYD